MIRRSNVRIANAGGYWGDDVSAIERQINGGPVDYVTIDFLAEITMSIMQKQRSRNPEAGFARDFVQVIRPLLKTIIDKDIRIVTNAGGVNPQGCAEALLAAAAEEGVCLKVGVVLGDDLMDRLEEVQHVGSSLDNMETGEPFSTIKDRVLSANVYFGAWPIVEALREGARIVITGRATDTGITLAPMIHELGWKATDLDNLAAGIIAGHIIECGAQATGGNFTDWRQVPSFDKVGYPIVEMNADGSFIVTKHEGTGGLVNVATVREQLLYEMGDPLEYLTPDVTADFTTVCLEQDGADRVRVSGIQGKPPPPSLKVSMSYEDGYKVSGSIILCGPDAVAKGDAFARIFWSRLDCDLQERHTEFIGYSSCHWHLSPETDPTEVMLRLSARDHDRSKLERFSRLLPALILSGPPGVAVTGGRPPVQDVVAYWPALIDRQHARATVEVTDGGEDTLVEMSWPLIPGPMTGRPDAVQPAFDLPPSAGASRKIVLGAICHGRSGDKGDTANIGLIARSDAAYAWIRQEITADRVKEYFGDICQGKVVRHEVPNLRALNFLLERALGGGGTLSLRVDPQGKTLSHALLAMEVAVDEAVLDTVPTDHLTPS